MTEIRTEIAQPAEVRLETSRARPTPRPAAQRFRDSLDEGGEVLLDGVESAASLVPGGPVATAAVRGARAAAGGAGGGVGSPEGPAAAGPGPDDPVASLRDETMRYLELQQRVSAENRRYTALSNVMKSRHESAKAAIHNIK